MSLQIRMNGDIMELNPDNKVELELVSPYFTYEDILSSKAAIPSLPASARNRLLLGFPDLLQTDVVNYRYHCEKYYNGQLLQSGIAVLTEAGPRQAGADYSFTVVQALGEFFGDYQTKLLSEIEFGSIELPEALTKIVNQGGKNAVCFPTIVNPDYYGSEGAQLAYSGLMNEYDNQAGPGGAGAYSESGPKVPFVFLDYLLGRIATLTGTTIDGDFFNRPEFRKLILFNTRALDGASAVTLSRHLPELTLAQLFLELRKFFNLSFTIRPAEKRFTIDFTNGILKKPTRKNWSEKALTAYKKQPETNRRMQLGSEQDSADALVKDKPSIIKDYLTPELGEETGIAPQKCKFSTLLMDEELGTAYCKQAGITEELNQLTNKFAPRLLFYTGDDDENALPTASSSLNDLSLYWTGVNGLAAKFWSLNEQLRQRWFYVSRSFDLTELDISTLDFTEKVHVNGVNYYVLKVTVSLPVKQPAQVLLVRA